MMGWAWPPVIGGRSDPHHGPDDGRKVVPIGAAHHDDESCADEKAEHKVACLEKFHTPTIETAPERQKRF
jgi:hypothetical protein